AAVQYCGKNQMCEEGSDDAMDAVCKCLPGYFLHNDGSCHVCLETRHCGSNADCIYSIFDGDRRCQCIENYSGDANVYCRKTCAAVEVCGKNQICEEGSDDAMDAICKCLPGYFLHNGSCH
ncbi:unnamed protein product, partial [Meganyctiphanes norvegica]